MYNHKTKKNNSNKTKAVFEKVVKNLQAIVDKGEYENFLKFQKKFRGYSFNNLILIYTQFPDATKVAGKKTWLKLKREVINDARKIWIVAPIPRQYSKKIKKMEDGIETEEILTVNYNAYRYVFVYDISQTTGEDIPLELKSLNITDDEDLTAFYKKLKQFSPVPVFERNLDSGIYGYYSEKNKEITIEKRLSDDRKVSTLLHELSHAIYDDFDYKTDRDLSEVFVESIAYIVADHFGLDTSLCSFNYILKWAKGDTKTVI